MFPQPGGGAQERDGRTFWAGSPVGPVKKRNRPRRIDEADGTGLYQKRGKKNETNIMETAL